MRNSSSPIFPSPVSPLLNGLFHTSNDGKSVHLNFAKSSGRETDNGRYAFNHSSLPLWRTSSKDNIGSACLTFETAFHGSANPLRWRICGNKFRISVFKRFQFMLQCIQNGIEISCLSKRDIDIDDNLFLSVAHLFALLRLLCSYQQSQKFRTPNQHYKTATDRKVPTEHGLSVYADRQRAPSRQLRP